MENQTEIQTAVPGEAADATAEAVLESEQGEDVTTSEEAQTEVQAEAAPSVILDDDSGAAAEDAPAVPGEVTPIQNEFVPAHSGFLPSSEEIDKAQLKGPILTRDGWLVQD